MWKARREGRRRSSAAHEEDAAASAATSAEADDITSSTSGPYSRRASHSPTHEHGKGESNALNQTSSPRDDRATEKRSKPIFFKSIFSTSSAPTSPNPTSSNGRSQHENHHHHHHLPHIHPPPIAPVMASAFVSKSRRVRFDLTLRIHDLNNVPLVSGTSFVKWHLPSSTAAEHRGRTPKAAIKDHRVVFGYEKATGVRLVVGKGGMLQECWINLEVLQEYSAGGRGERITLGTIKLNLAEYVEASEAALQSPVTPSPGPNGASAAAAMAGVLGAATTTSMSDSNGNGGHGSTQQQTTTTIIPDEGVTRRYLMQDSKINSTLKIGVHMRHVEGTRDYVAPPLRTAPVFGGIAGIISSSEPAAMASTAALNGKFDPEAEAAAGGAGGKDGAAAGGDSTPNLSSRNKEAGEMQDMYRRTLAAFWASQPGELKADECIEDIFAGGDGWGKGGKPPNISPVLSVTDSGGGGGGVRRESGGGGGGGGSTMEDDERDTQSRDGSNNGGARSRRSVMMNTHKRNMSSRHHHHHHGHHNKVKPPRKGSGELDEMDVRDDLVGWLISEKTYS